MSKHRTPEGADDAVHVESEINGAGTYTLTVTLTADRAFALDSATAREYALMVIAAAMHADHDAAVSRQIMAMDRSNAMDAALVIFDLREKRGELKPVDGVPLTYEAIVSVSTGEPVVTVRHTEDSAVAWQWTPDEARQHAMQVLTGAVGIGLDDTYFTFLRERVGLDEGTARHVIHHVGDVAHSS